MPPPPPPPPPNPPTRRLNVLADKKLISLGTTTVTGGTIGSGTSTYEGNFQGTRDSTDVALAESQLATFIQAIIDISVRFPIPSIRDYTILYDETCDYYPMPIYKCYTIYYTPENLNFPPGTRNVFNGNGDPEAISIILVNNDITFDGDVSITLTGRIKPENIFWVANKISFANFNSNSNTTLYGNFVASGSIELPPNVTLYGSVSSLEGSITFSGLSSVIGNSQNVVCYAKGTLILTKQGFVPIENIKAGDKIVTKGKIYNSKFIKTDSALKIEPVVWASKFKVKNLNSKTRPICIKKNTFSKNYPFKDLYVSPNHSLLLNGKMVLAKNIVNGETIYQDNECDNVEYYHLECEDHSAIVANGILAESYLEAENRNAFEKSVSLRNKLYLKKIHMFR